MPPWAHLLQPPLEVPALTTMGGWLILQPSFAQFPIDRGACRPCNDTEILMAICTSDFVIRGSIRSVSNDAELQESVIGVVEAYKQGLRPAVGYELNPWLLCLSNYRAWKAGYHGKVSFLKKDLWKVNLSDCHNVIVFLAPSVKPPLAAKLLAELPDEARVVAGRFPFPSWTPTSTLGQGLEQVWAYDMKEVRRAAQSSAEGSPV
ncbi:PREDICTED: protein FAM173A [Charadrius vociferus]|uniref:protein FAM173A n=1 Tax=Charadrius vociferus TaxID=50402 RepID=UPI0005219F9D|nr:PREDICTED: protein FAM173A [Charadrius vociferus]